MKKIYALLGLLFLYSCSDGGDYQGAPYRGPGNDYYDGYYYRDHGHHDHGKHHGHGGGHHGHGGGGHGHHH